MKLDLSQIEYSHSDKKRNITLPSELNEELAEFIGILMGDGYIYNGSKKYTIGIVGNPITDRTYYEHIIILVKNIFNLDVKSRFISRAIRIIFNSKAIFQYITCFFIPYYKKGKSDKIEIPMCIYSNWEFARKTIRGISDTDGSIFTAPKPGCPTYPSIEITTSSIILANQIRYLLIKNIFEFVKFGNINQIIVKRCRIRLLSMAIII